jgi:hypothetical protein
MKVRGCTGMLTLPAPVAQMDRVLASEAKGRAFESRRARQLRCYCWLHDVAMTYQSWCSVLNASADEPLCYSHRLYRADQRVHQLDFPSEDHSLDKARSRVRVLRELESFLATHLTSAATREQI